MDESSGVGVLDKAVGILGALSSGPAALSDLVARTGLPRPTAYRLAVALEHHRLVDRDGAGRFVLGGRLGELAGTSRDPLLAAADVVLPHLRDDTGESAQLYRRAGDQRRCVAAAERHTGLRDTVPVGALLPMTAGSGAQVLLAWTSPGDRPVAAAFSDRTLATVRRRGYAVSLAEREAGVASVSAPVRDRTGTVIAAVCVSGPLDRLGRSPATRLAGPVRAAAQALADRL